MIKPLLFVVAAGVAIGLAWPSGDQQSKAVVAETGEPRETVLEREANGHFYVDAKVNGELVHFIVDTGATGVALTEEDARRVGLAFSPSEFEYVGEGAAGPVRGKLVTIDTIEVDGKTVEDVFRSRSPAGRPVAARPVLSVADGRGADARRLYGAALG